MTGLCGEAAAITRRMVRSSTACSTANGPATAAPIGISIAITTPLAGRLDDPAEAAQRDVALRGLRVAGAVDREQDVLEQLLDITVVPLGRRAVALARRGNLLGDSVVALAKDDFDVESHFQGSGCRVPGAGFGSGVQGSVRGSGFRVPRSAVSATHLVRSPAGDM